MVNNMKIIFLDFDGVLNSEKYLRNCGRYGVIADPVRMIYLKKIVDATGAKIVLSTSWREHWNENTEECDETGLRINEIFRVYGLCIYSKTPKLDSFREDEIKKWLDEHEGIESFVVLDDAFLSADFLNGHFVRTSNYRDGLNEENTMDAIKILGESIFL